jgi:hypothetical protein
MLYHDRKENLIKKIKEQTYGYQRKVERKV